MKDNSMMVYLMGKVYYIIKMGKNFMMENSTMEKFVVKVLNFIKTAQKK